MRIDTRRIDKRQWATALAAAGGTSAAAGFLQPWLTDWMAVFTWATPFCGSTQDGEVLPVNFAWTVWWTATSMLVGVLAGRSAARGRADRAVPKALQPGLIAAAAAGSLTVLAALRGLVGVSSAAAAVEGEASCVALSDFVPLVAWGIAFGALFALAALRVREIAIGLVGGWLFVWAGNVLIGIVESTGLHHLRQSSPLDLAYAFEAWMSVSAAQDTATIVMLAVLPLTAILAYWITRNGPRSLLAAVSVYLIVGLSIVCGDQHYWGYYFLIL
jgi:hypothetical protein